MGRETHRIRSRDYLTYEGLTHGLSRFSIRVETPPSKLTSTPKRVSGILECMHESRADYMGLHLQDDSVLLSHLVPRLVFTKL